MSTCRRMWTDRQIRSMAVDSVEEKEKLEVFEHIVDKDGHPRFIEGAVRSNVEGINVSFGKWSLSGSHLMVVASGTFANTTVLTGKTILETVDLPKWIYDKVYPNIAGSEIIEYKTFTFYASDYTTQNASIRFDKSGNKLNCFCAATLTLTADRSFRIQYDLLIDDE